MAACDEFNPQRLDTQSLENDFILTNNCIDSEGRFVLYLINCMLFALLSTVGFATAAYRMWFQDGFSKTTPFRILLISAVTCLWLAISWIVIMSGKASWITPLLRGITLEGVNAFLCLNIYSSLHIGDVIQSFSSSLRATSLYQWTVLAHTIGRIMFWFWLGSSVLFLGLHSLAAYLHYESMMVYQLMVMALCFIVTTIYVGTLGSLFYIMASRLVCILNDGLTTIESDIFETAEAIAKTEASWKALAQQSILAPTPALRSDRSAEVSKASPDYEELTLLHKEIKTLNTKLELLRARWRVLRALASKSEQSIRAVSILCLAVGVLLTLGVAAWITIAVFQEITGPTAAQVSISLMGGRSGAAILHGSSWVFALGDLLVYFPGFAVGMWYHGLHLIASPVGNQVRP
ncbi:uncharacterized protein BJ171DRAFT_528815 [Polychytrium aggregatum]|uniref:uncharacterized protein n=1 Tax=Polychytrium aggregatum TaxID=110093 RepID=UPI0022FEC0B0|nr:uncharacterized protein BJ171DRAFT_528815 [Polychytrium aggregatum]KAI9193304.1 hypothetical protein BJ171DRAFT_528815 [Polychytrium aggregatum]